MYILPFYVHAAAWHVVLVKAAQTHAADALLLMLSLIEAATGGTAATEKIKLAVPSFKRRTQACRWAASEGHAGSAACPDAIEDMDVDAEQSSPSGTSALAAPADVHFSKLSGLCYKGAIKLNKRGWDHMRASSIMGSCCTWRLVLSQSYMNQQSAVLLCLCSTQLVLVYSMHIAGIQKHVQCLPVASSWWLLICRT